MSRSARIPRKLKKRFKKAGVIGFDEGPGLLFGIMAGAYDIIQSSRPSAPLTKQRILDILVDLERRQSERDRQDLETIRILQEPFVASLLPNSPKTPGASNE